MHVPSTLALTIFLVVEYLHLLLLRALQELAELHDAEGAAQRPLQEIADGGLLHDLGTRVARELAEAIVAEDDGHRLHLRVADDEFSVWKGGDERGIVRGTDRKQVCLFCLFKNQ